MNTMLRRGLLAALVLAATAAQADDAATVAELRYRDSGLPDMLALRGHSYVEVRSVLGEPRSMTSDEQGDVSSAVFLVPLQGQALPPAQAPSAPDSAVKKSLFGALKRRAVVMAQKVGGSVVPEAGAVTSSLVEDASRPAPAAAARVWSCSVRFAQSRLVTGVCNSASLPLGS